MVFTEIDQRYVSDLSVPTPRRSTTFVVHTEMLHSSYEKSVLPSLLESSCEERKKKFSGDCTTVATQPRQLHYSNNLSKRTPLWLLSHGSLKIKQYYLLRVPCQGCFYYCCVLFESIALFGPGRDQAQGTVTHSSHSQTVLAG